MFTLVLHPGEPSQERIDFAMSEADLDDAEDYGRAERNDEFQKRLRDAAYHKVLELEVTERVLEEPWVLLHDGTITARNHLAMGIREEDLK
jgi:hypothetical protein